MAIVVLCPGCRKRFSVSDQFAGKSGPCPSCKTVIKIPGPTEEVKIHGPEDFAHGGRSVTGELVLKPIERSEARFNVTVAVAIGLATVAVCLVAWFGGRAGLFRDSLIMSAVGLVLVTPPIVVAGYTFLRASDDLEPYRGRPLYLRAAICSAAYLVLWGLFSFGIWPMLTGDLWNWLLVAPPFVILGGLAALATLDLDFGSGICHYGFYLIVTVALRALASLEPIWSVPERVTPF